MDLQKEDFPATVQAYELVNDKEIFIAEQVVNSQAEIETFTTRYSGKLIKAKTVPVVENKKYGDQYSNSNMYTKKRSSTTGLIMFIVILVVAALIIYGFSTGWIQTKFHLKI